MKRRDSGIAARTEETDVDSFTGEIRIFTFNFAPTDWAFCNGQQLPIAQNQQLYAVIGTIYGPQAGENFILPNLVGRAPMATGTGAGLTPRALAAATGTLTETVSTVSQLPSHTHRIQAWRADPDLVEATPQSDRVLSRPVAKGVERYVSKAFTNNAPSATYLHADTIESGGGAAGTVASHDNVQPYVSLNFCISLLGQFPSPG
jgi:microcystin-dependent protein